MIYDVLDAPKWKTENKQKFYIYQFDKIWIRSIILIINYSSL